jgi:site-specific recombinase XerD
LPKQEVLMSVDRSRIRVVGPLAVFSTAFADELARKGYTLISKRSQMRLLAHLSRWLMEQGHDAGDLHKSELNGFLCARRAAGYTALLSIKALQPLLDYLRGLGVAPAPTASVATGPVEVALERYRRYLIVERAVAIATANDYVHSVRPFLAGRVSPDGTALTLGHLSAADVIAFVMSRCAEQGRGGAPRTARTLRSFLRFLHVDGVIEKSLVSAVPSIAGRRLSTLPKGLEPDQVRRLLVSCGDSPQSSFRDIAIVTMLVRLGLRAIEIARLQLDDIDWRAGEIVVRGKGNCTERLPLPSDVGDAVATYLQRGRPISVQERVLFARIKAPHRAMSSGAVSSAVAEAATRAGIGRVHAHRLRHTAATETLRAGASLMEVGQLLRHRHVVTTAIYAKVNREALRMIARPWPGDVA